VRPLTPRVVRRGVVSVVVVNYRNADDTLDCLTGFASLDWPSTDLEVIVVDNGSGDGSVERIGERFPRVRVVALPDNRGFAGGCNRGVDAATGEYVAFLNNDARPDPGWVHAAAGELRSDITVACVASKVLDWDGGRIDFVDAGMAFYGHGFKLRAGELDEPGHDFETDVLFASGAAMVVRAETFRQVGGFDERYFLFFEAVDLGWRLWLLGYRVRYVPASVVYHRHHRTMERFGDWHHQYLLERNALFTIFKNYDDESLRVALPAALMLAVRRGVTIGGDDPHALDLEARGFRVTSGAVGAPLDAETERAAGDDSRLIEVDKHTAAAAYAVDALVEAMPGLAESRRALQAARQRADHEVFRLFRMPLFANIGDPRFVEGFRATVEALGVEGMFGSRRRVLVATGDVLQPKMAGPAIRAWHIARALAREHEVQLVTTNRCALTHPDFAVVRVDDRGLSRLVEWADVIIFQGNLMSQHEALRRSRKILVVDVYDPFHLEVLEQARDLEPRERLLAARRSTEVLNEQLMRGDFFLCASEKQRDFWLGQLAAVGRVNPLTYDLDESMESLIAVVPFGLTDEAPRRARPVLRGVVPGIGPDDKVVLWGGGVYNWFDPLTLLRAVDKLRRRLPEVRLYFLGLTHPNPDVGEMRMATDTLALAAELGLTGTHVFFNEGWVDYDDRQSYLLEADVGVSCHLDHVETAFSFRTRILDYLWASLPIVATGGDALAGVIEAEGLGLTVGPGDADALEEALFRLLDDGDLNARCRSALARVAPRYRWSRVLEPLLEFCRAPRRAPDLLDPETAVIIRDPLPSRWWRAQRWRRDLRTGLAYLRGGEVRLLAAKARRRLSELRRRS
jgi:GT2 family glycosyltransferase